MRALIALSLAAVALIVPGGAIGRGDADVAALQVALYAHGVYAGTIDGVQGPLTATATRRFQQRHRLVADGVAGAGTRRALGQLGRPLVGARVLRQGAVGWDVSALQFLLAWQGFPSGTLDGGFGPHVQAALQRFQRFAGLLADGIAGPTTMQALSAPVPRIPLALAWPIPGAPIGDRFGPRGDGFHPGVDFPAPAGSAVGAARSGLVVFAGWDSGGYGNLVVLAHGLGVESFYAHLSAVLVSLHQRVETGAMLGRVGATGEATGPHLHFEVRVRGAAADSLPALG